MATYMDMDSLINMDCLERVEMEWEAEKMFKALEEFKEKHITRFKLFQRTDSKLLANPPVSSCQDEGGTASKEGKLGYLDTTLEMETLTGDGEGRESESEPPKL